MIDQPVQTGPEYEAVPTRKNRFSSAGLLFAFLFWPLGLALSIIGFVRSRKWDGASRLSAILGLVISLLAGAATVLCLVLVSSASGALAGDPGCVAAKSTLNGLNGKLAAFARQEQNLTVVTPILTGIYSVRTGFMDAAHDSASLELITVFSTAYNDASAYVTQLQAPGVTGPALAAQMKAPSAALSSDISTLDHLCGTSG